MSYILTTRPQQIRELTFRLIDSDDFLRDLADDVVHEGAGPCLLTYACADYEDIIYSLNNIAYDQTTGYFACGKLYHKPSGLTFNFDFYFSFYNDRMYPVIDLQNTSDNHIIEHIINANPLTRELMKVTQIPNGWAIRISKHERKENIMSETTNSTNAAAILNENTTTVEIVFNANREGTYTYRVEKSVAATLKPKDEVVVRNTNGIAAFGTVVEVHDESQIELSSRLNYAWVVAKIDYSGIEAQIEAERQIVQQIRNAERQRIREQIAKEYLPAIETTAVEQN